MKEEVSQEAQMLQGLMGAIGKECPQCGETNPSDANVCEYCGIEFEVEEEDEATLSILQAVGVGGMISDEEVDPELKKVPVGQSQNLILLRKTVEMIRTNQITHDEYKKNVSKVLSIARNGVELFKADVVKKKVAQLNENIQSLVWDTAALYEDFMHGCQKMMEYQGGTDIRPAVEGLEYIETTMQNMDSLHDEIIDTSKEIKKDKEKEKDKK